MNLSSAPDDNTLLMALLYVPKNCILVIEDVDHYEFKEGIKRTSESKENSDDNGKVSVSGILNALDGITSLEESSKYIKKKGESNMRHVS